MFDINIIISEYDYKLIIATVYSFDYCSLITVLFHMIFKINISQDFDDAPLPLVKLLSHLYQRIDWFLTANLISANAILCKYSVKIPWTVLILLTWVLNKSKTVEQYLFSPQNNWLRDKNWPKKDSSEILDKYTSSVNTFLNVQGPIDSTFLHILDEEPIS